jgi:hypothetical protein
MNYTFFDKPFNRFAIEQAMKHDEEIVCTNATVVMDSNGNLSYFNNDNLVCMISEER